MVDVDLSKIVIITVKPSSSLVLTQEKACRGCSLKHSKKDGNYRSREAMIYCGNECSANIKRGHENGKPFEVKIVSTELTANYQQPNSTMVSETIPPANPEMFFYRV